MRRRTFLAGVATTPLLLAGCLDSDGDLLHLEAPDDASVAEAEIDLSAGEYALEVAFVAFDGDEPGFDPYVAFNLYEGTSYDEAIVDVEVHDEGATQSVDVTVEASGIHTAVLYAPTQESDATATLRSA